MKERYLRPNDFLTFRGGHRPPVPGSFRDGHRPPVRVRLEAGTARRLNPH
jgi:hypothetical protein